MNNIPKQNGDSEFFLEECKKFFKANDINVAQKNKH